MPGCHCRARRRGFTLIEILIVVVILGVLASIVIASFTTSADDARRGAFADSTRTLAIAIERYRLDTGAWPEDASSGVLPSGFAPYVAEVAFERGTPVGGVWDTELASYGVASAVGVHFDGTGATRDDAYMTPIDVALDDGDLETGRFRRLDADRYYWIVAF